MAFELGLIATVLLFAFTLRFLISVWRKEDDRRLQQNANIRAMFDQLKEMPHDFECECDKCLHEARERQRLWDKQMRERRR